MAASHVVISGTGRAGTTFLVQLLTHLGLDTGFDPHTMEALPATDLQAALKFTLLKGFTIFSIPKPITGKLTVLKQAFGF